MKISIFFLVLCSLCDGFFINKFTNTRNIRNTRLCYNRRYQITRPDYLEKMRRLNSKNTTIQNESILNNDENGYGYHDAISELQDQTNTSELAPRLRINIHKHGFLQALGLTFENPNGFNNEEPGEPFGDFEEDETRLVTT